MMRIKEDRKSYLQNAKVLRAELKAESLCEKYRLTRA
jgi:hypothetical protein